MDASQHGTTSLTRKHFDNMMKEEVVAILAKDPTGRQGHKADTTRTKLSAMMHFDEFQHHLHELLTHLYDPIYQPAALLLQMLGAPPHPGLANIQRIAKAAIAQLAPTADTPSSARSRRFYDLLSYRYIQELTQEETAHRLGITPRHLRREQQQAIHALAQQLWEAWQSTSVGREQRQPTVAPSPPTVPLTAENAAWQAQVYQEVARLQQGAPSAVAEVTTTIAGVIKVSEPLAIRHGVGLRVARPQPIDQGSDRLLLLAIHPSALRQILLTAIERLCQQMTTGEIVFHHAVKAQQIEITIRGGPLSNPQPLTTALMDELAAAYQGHITCQVTDDAVSFHIWLPLAEQITVLVIDDNDDLVHFYRRYTALTRYELVQVAQGQQAVALAKALQPALIVLDVMLPDLDGWDLLTQLYEDSTTAAIPVIVCSVIQRAELAMALGAVASLAKPVDRLAFIAALDHAYAQVAEKGLPE